MAQRVKVLATTSLIPGPTLCWRELTSTLQASDMTVGRLSLFLLVTLLISDLADHAG